MYTATFREEQASQTRWIPPANLYATVHQGRLMFKITGDRAYELNDWSFAQLCTYLNADRGVIERLSVETAAQVLYRSDKLSRFGSVKLRHLLAALSWNVGYL